MRTLSEKYRTNLWMPTVCLVISLVASVFISSTEPAMGMVIFGLVALLSLLLLIFSNYKNGFLLLVFYAFFMFHVYRVAPSLPYFPLGTVVEIFLVVLLFAIIVHQLKSGAGINSRNFANPIFYAILIFSLYSIVLLFNPASRAVVGRIQALREIFAFVVLFFVTIHAFQTKSFIYFFEKFWILFSLIAALYGIYQEVFGLQDWELKWLYSQPDEGRLSMVWGHIRKWSFLSDINAFGLLMAYSGIVCLILALGPFSLVKKFFFAGSAILMLISMTFSGTRTAMAMVVFGLGFYVTATLYEKKSIIFLTAFCLGMLALFFGPFYGPNFSRLRSTFKVKEDPSMNVRDHTRATMQPYARSHPFGGGINTTGALGLRYDPGHPLAGEWDTDSGYLKTALERGWVGLLLQLALYATIVIYGLNFFYRTQDRVAANLCMAYLSGFFALTVANYAQDSLEQKPINLIVMASIASIISLSVHDKQPQKQ